ncbi:MAG TPA: molybdopterin-guanine dinucleotide biosynthesis protein B, partial [Syntrophomonadaceae bacterium]|nr:molybdopterin-guanine dinucleotide biosynthesis protein B [Syntrophomonadaceae bacterium]
ELVILEGYKESPYPKIEVLRGETGREPLGVEHTIAYVSDFSLETDLPVFTFDQPEELSAFLLDRLAEKQLSN